jgi:hypothetical protein
MYSGFMNTRRAPGMTPRWAMSGKFDRRSRASRIRRYPSLGLRALFGDIGYFFFFGHAASREFFASRGAIPLLFLAPSRRLQACADPRRGRAEKKPRARSILHNAKLLQYHIIHRKTLEELDRFCRVGT